LQRRQRDVDHSAVDEGHARAKNCCDEHPGFGSFTTRRYGSARTDGSFRTRLLNRITHRGKERGKAKAAIGYSLRPQETDRPREANPCRCDGGVTRRRLLQTPFNPRRILVYSSSVMSPNSPCASSAIPAVKKTPASCGRRSHRPSNWSGVPSARMSVSMKSPLTGL